jgi:hypothetical protein
MLRHDDLRFGHIDNLSSAVVRRHVRRQPLIARRADLRIMVDDNVRILDPTQGLSRMTFLPPWLVAGWFPQALDTGRAFFSPSLDGGLPLFPLFSPSRRFNSATRAFDAASASFSAAFSTRSGQKNAVSLRSDGRPDIDLLS